MNESNAAEARPLGNADLARVLSPLLLFAAHVVYLALWSTEPFLKKWLDGSFSFFLALVLCNIVRARVVAASAAAAGDGDGEEASGASPGAGQAVEGGASPGAGQAGDGHRRA